MKQFLFAALMLLCCVFSWGQPAQPIFEETGDSPMSFRPNGPIAKPATTLLNINPVVGEISYVDPIPMPAYETWSMHLRLDSPYYIAPMISSYEDGKAIYVPGKCVTPYAAGNAKYRCLVGDGYIAEFTGKAITNRPFDKTWYSDDCNTAIYYFKDAMIAMSDGISGQISVFDTRYPDGYIIYSDWFTGAKSVEGE